MGDIEKLIRAVETADSAQGLCDAVQSLAAARHEAAIPSLIEVLGYNNPGAAVAAVDGLIGLGEIAVSPILEKLDGYNYGARAWATRALALIGDPRALDLLVEAASSDFSLSVRRAAAKGLGSLLWHKLPPEKRSDSQTQVFETLLLVSQDPEWVVRYASIVGLQSLGSSLEETLTDLLTQILDRFREMLKTDPELAVRSRTYLALQELNSLSKL
jgi:phycocyanobilin lyase beta subunit